MRKERSEILLGLSLQLFERKNSTSRLLNEGKKPTPPPHPKIKKSRYSYDPPTGAFSLEVFKQAFAAVQASVVHLQGVPTSMRFALVPMGPPLLSYSSDCRALVRWEPSSDSKSGGSKGSVVLDVDRDVRKGDPVVAW